jgi:Fe-S cluster assembly protein SufD
MSSALEQTTPSVPAASAALGRALYDSDATAKLRADAANAAERMAFPDSRRMRPWKYLDVSGLNLDGYQPGLGAAEKAPAAELRARYGVGETAALLVQSNSETVVTESGEAITLADFADADLAGRGLIEKHLNLGIPYARSKFTALHYAYLRGGVLVNVAANAEPKLPVRIVRDYQAGKQIAAPHTLIVTGTNSRVSIVEDFRSSEEDIVVLPVVEIVPGAGSEVRYTVLHRWGTQTQVFTEQRFLGARDAAFIGFNFVTSGKVVKGHVQCSLEERGSSSELFGLTLGDEHQHVDFYTLQDHIAPDTRSDLLYKSALTDSAKSVYYGLTRVGLEAHNADANQ